MKKSNIVSIIFFLSIAGYFLCAVIAEFFWGDISIVETIKIIVWTFISSFFLSAIIFYISNKFIWRSDQRVKSGTKLFNKISIFVVLSACALGAYVSTDKLLDKNEEARVAKEKNDAMTDDERLLIREKARLEAEANERVEAELRKVKELEQLRFSNTLAFVNALKSNMRDPKSFEIEYVGSNEIGSIVCVEYRAKNGFGGMNREISTLVNKKVSQNSEVWNRNCLKNLYDMKSVILLLP